MRKFLQSALGIKPAAVPTGHALIPVPVIRGHAEVLMPQPQPLAYLDRAGGGGADNWGNPNVMPLRSADDAVRAGWAPVTGHVRHLVQNTGWLSGAVDQFTSYAIGSGLTPNITPAHELLGHGDAEYWRSWARDLELIFQDWADDPQAADERGMFTFGALQAQAMRSWFTTGDVLGVLNYDENRNGWRTSINVIDPVRVATPQVWQSHYQTRGLVDGIELDDKGRPIAFWLSPLPGAHDTRGTRVPFASDAGRQLVAHAFIGEAGQARGISPFASVVEAMKRTMELSDAMLVAAHAAASVVGVVTSDLPTGELARGMVGEGGDPLSAMMERRTGWHETLAENKANVTLGRHGKVYHLSTGERFDLHAAKDHYSAYPEHLKALLREISRASGLPYEMFSLDRKAATYSSGRLGLLDFWSLVELRRSTLIEPLCRLALFGVAEEAIDRKYLPYPTGLRGFRKQKAAACKARWFGPARPSVDELKAVRAAAERLKAGLTSLAEEGASLGSDWEATMRQRSHERTTALDLGLPDTWQPAPQNGGKK